MEEFVEFLKSCPTAYHAVAEVEKMLKKEGYVNLPESQPWAVTPGGRYYTIRGGSSLIAFRMPQTPATGFMMTASHSDHPSFKIKEQSTLTGTYTRLATEKYGGMIMSTWADRPLSVAGQVMVETEDGVRPRLVNIDRDLLVIPSLAIHLNRNVNEGFAWNPACDTVPLLGIGDKTQQWLDLLEEVAGGKVLGKDLYLYLRQEPRIWGFDREFISAAALDDLTCVWGCTQGFLRAQESRAIPVLCLFDGEEVGSASAQGADSTFLEEVLKRICAAGNLSWPQLAAQSFMVSADNGHAIHPNHPEHSDPANAPMMGGGLVLKFNADLRYSTSGLSAAVFRKICGRAGVPVQTYHNRADLRGGSTLGHISLSHVSVPTADIGLAQLAMHSCYETAGTADVAYLERAMTTYYGSCLEYRAGELVIGG